MRQISTVMFAALATAGCDAARGGDPAGPTARSNLVGASPTEFVTTGGAEITLHVDDFTERWSFVARRNQDLTAQGEFQFTAKIAGNIVTAHGDVLCFTVEGKRSRLGGVITRSSTPGLAGNQVIWNVEDNGEGTNSPPDLASALKFGEASSYCLAGIVSDLLPVETGNVQVHH